MATAYTNTGGTGNRTSIITITSNLSLEPNSGALPDLIDGAYTNTLYPDAQAAATHFIKFQFSTAYVIDEFKWYQDALTANGVWNWQGSNDGSTWTTILGNLTLGTAATTTYSAPNTTAYLYYQLAGVSGNLSSAKYFEEIEFKIGLLVPANSWWYWL